MTQIGPRQTFTCSSVFSVPSVDANIFVKGNAHMNSKLLNATGMHNPRNVMKTSTMVAQRSREDGALCKWFSSDRLIDVQFLCMNFSVPSKFGNCVI